MSSHIDKCMTFDHSFILDIIRSRLFSINMKL